jgi:hypothetical protein
MEAKYRGTVRKSGLSLKPSPELITKALLAELDIFIAESGYNLIDLRKQRTADQKCHPISR